MVARRSSWLSCWLIAVARESGQRPAARILVRADPALEDRGVHSCVPGDMAGRLFALYARDYRLLHAGEPIGRYGRGRSRTPRRRLLGLRWADFTQPGFVPRL